MYLRSVVPKNSVEIETRFWCSLPWGLPVSSLCAAVWNLQHLELFALCFLGGIRLQVTSWGKHVLDQLTSECLWKKFLGNGTFTQEFNQCLLNLPRPARHLCFEGGKKEKLNKKSTCVLFLYDYKEATVSSKPKVTNSLLVLLRYWPMVYSEMKISQPEWGN